MINKEIEELEKQKMEIANGIMSLDQKKNEMLIRLAELQGIIKYLKSKEDKNSKLKVKEP